MAVSTLCLLLILAGLTVAVEDSYTLTCQQVDEVTKDIERVILSSTAYDEDGRPFFFNIAGFVRLSFHMCTGGMCIGCINLDDPGNFHLDSYVTTLETVRRRHPFISRGDLWALAGIVALRTSENITNQRYGDSQRYMQQILRFRFGRKDCPTAPFTTELFPFPNLFLGLDHVRSFFNTIFGFNDKQTVAIIGAHTLGGLRNAQTNQVMSQWTDSPDILDNAFYIALRNASNGWYQSGHKLCVPCNPINFWTNSRNKRLMFNTDMSLFKDLKFTSEDDSQASCTYNKCKPSKTAAIVNDYAKSNDRWLQAFANAYMVMIEIGYDGNDCLKDPVSY